MVMISYITVGEDWFGMKDHNMYTNLWNVQIGTYKVVYTKTR